MLNYPSTLLNSFTEPCVKIRIYRYTQIFHGFYGSGNRFLWKIIIHLFMFDLPSANGDFT